MQHRSLRRNYALNVVNTVGAVVFYFITFPYAARVLGPECIGEVNFYRSIVDYITLVCCLGIPLYGVREIACVAGQTQLRATTAMEILMLQLMLSVVGLAVAALLCATVPQIRAGAPLFMVLSTSILFVAIGCEWFFSGTEDFAYITVRGLCVRVLYAMVLYCFVHGPSDLLLYGALTVLGSYGSHVFNLLRFRHISAGDWQLKTLRPLRHLQPAVRVFGVTAASAVYLNLNVVLLGFISGDTAVGYLMGAMKVVVVPLGLLTALQTTLLPRTSALLAADRPDEYRDIVRKSMHFVWAIGLPLGVALALLADPVIALLCGPAFGPSVAVLRIMGPMLVLIAMVCVLNAAVFIPLKRERLAMYACLAGAAVSLAVNLLLTPSLQQLGAAWASLAAEAAVAVVMALYVWRRTGSGLFGYDLLRSAVATAAMAAVILGGIRLSGSMIWQLGFLPFAAAGVYAVTYRLLRRATAVESTR